MSLGNRCGFYSRRDVYRTSDLSCKGSNSESRCRQPGYHPKRKIMTMPEAIQAYEDALREPLYTALLSHSVVYAAL